MNALAYVVFGAAAGGFSALVAYLVYSELVLWPRAKREWQERNDALHAQGLPRDPVKPL